MKNLTHLKNKLTKTNKAVLFIGFLIIVSLLYGTLILVGNISNKATPFGNGTFFGPTGVPTNPSAQNGISSHTAPAVQFSQEGEGKFLSKRKYKVPLSAADQQAEHDVLTRINNQSAVLATTSNYFIEYVKSADLFMVELNSTDLGNAKRQATAWFESQGFTHQGICDLPVFFYVNYGIAQQLRPLHLTFSPVAEGC